MTILVAVEELRIGGAQTFALRLAQALHEAGHLVYLYNMYWQYTEHDLVKRLAPDVELVQYQPCNRKLDNFIMRADSWLQRRGKHSELRARSLRKHLRRVIQEKQIEVVSSNTFKADHLCAQVLLHFPHIPLIITMHGDYEQFLVSYREGKNHVIPAYITQLTETVSRLNGVAYLSDQNLESLRPEVVGITTDHIHVRRIYNGLDGRFSNEAFRFTRAALNISDDALVYGMVARGVPEKGWEPVIQAYQQLRAEILRPMNLVLVGASFFLDQLREKYKADESLRFLGFVNNPVDCVMSFDVGILASSLRESLPNSIAEYLFCGKAVISTDIGEIRQMIRTSDGQEAGLLVEFPVEELTDTRQLYQAMRCYATDNELLSLHQQLAQQAFEKFDMKYCVQAYTALYQSCQGRLAREFA
ncbi:glycosyltransferase family 4 protein [Hymenobacter weizhouensis]|uniref:glycosyltransferase family 4 protein n=1 Tax=Hymenobacter sp. YIM 151500-1 TaxID=2987689 RepID=UPI00222640AA|nr:glycosyltransferase family 4 protein [Hymenobacter sp. YIM 151500-1]UYZ61360.1 glycosyltransferase family 4 protein [Hymenobacter sp. YIM 151500-1]